MKVADSLLKVHAFLMEDALSPIKVDELIKEKVVAQSGMNSHHADQETLSDQRNVRYR